MLKYLVPLVLFISVNAFSQETLDLGKAVKIGLENNYSIKLAKNSLSISANNVTLGNAGFLPKLDASASGSGTNNHVHQEFLSGQVTDQSNATSNSVTAGIALNWTLFDGMNMFINFSRLRELNAQGEINARATVENNVASIMSGYYNIVSIQQTIRAILDAIRISEERVKIAEDKYNLGSGSKLDLLQARVDLNADRSNLLRQQLNLAQAKVSLNQLMGLESTKDFLIQDTIVINGKMDYNVLKARVVDENSSLKSAGKDISIASLNLNGLKSLWYPSLGFFVDYNYSRAEAPLGSPKLNRNNGITYGLNLSFNIFNGFNTSRQIENARISLMTSQLQYGDLKNRLDASFEQEYTNYSNNLQQVKMEEENLDVARQNAEIALDRFKYGTYSSLELSVAQKSYLDAQSRLVAAQYAAKKSEIELMRLSGQIIK
ncbi:MAG: TolC family protein [Ignavibacteria bacterium]|jgi:outer membrane protein TolC|nr:TolC family protein [Ignavibacteria bacterium]MCU7504507.1 TolC family protein [Ignavibacteria bacterium]MCU7517828.1 TolC family protein [Ignavibacteria bacterium]